MKKKQPQKGQDTLLTKITNYQSSRWIDILLYLTCILFVVVGAIVSIVRYWQYDIFYIDFGIFDQVIWSVSRFQPPIIDHFLVSGKWNFADHFNPSIYLLAPLYWITDRQEIILFAQALAVGLSGFVLYKIGIEVLKNKFVSLSVVMSYFLFAGLQNAVITEFHEITVMTLPMMLTFWAVVKKNVKLYFLFLIITLGFKEALFLAGVGIGIAVFFLRREWWKISIITIILSLLWGFISIKFIIPAFSNGLYIYDPSLPQGVIDKALSLVDRPTKRRTIFFSFLSFGFLPIFSPAFWFLILQDYALRFMPLYFETRWYLTMHYNAPTAVYLSLASLFGLRYLTRFRRVSSYMFIIGLVLIVNGIFLYRFVLRGPFGLAYNPVFYAHTKDFDYLNNLITKVPKHATIMTQNNLAARFTHQKVWLLRENYTDYNPDYIMIDNHDGQNPNNFFVTQISDMKSFITRIKQDNGYSLIYESGDQYLFQRKK